MVYHVQLLLFMVDVYVGACDVTDKFDSIFKIQYAFVHVVALVVRLRFLRRMDSVWTFDIIAVSESNLFAIVMRKIQVIFPKWVRKPVRHTDERRTVDVIEVF